MIKDLRGLLEPGLGYDPEHKSSKQVPLALRRSAASPGQPRVYRVQAGFLCGLCGRVNDDLNVAFDCLGRCTIELRLRTPASPSFSGRSSHFACAACGKSFVNASDAEQCFEGCLGKIRPTPFFHHTLRRIQSRYLQRLKAHGLRALERIDALAEHTLMLTALSKGQAALSLARQHLSALLTGTNTTPLLPETPPSDVSTFTATAATTTTEAAAATATATANASAIERRPQEQAQEDARDASRPAAENKNLPDQSDNLELKSAFESAVAAQQSEAAEGSASSEMSMLLDLMKDSPEVAESVSDAAESDFVSTASSPEEAEKNALEDVPSEELSDEPAKVIAMPEQSESSNTVDIDALDLDGFEGADGKTSEQLLTERKVAFAEELLPSDQPTASGSLPDEEGLEDVFEEATHFASAQNSPATEKNAVMTAAEVNLKDNSPQPSPAPEDNVTVSDDSIFKASGMDFDDLLNDDPFKEGSAPVKPNKSAKVSPRSGADEENSEDQKLLALLDGNPDKSAA